MCSHPTDQLVGGEFGALAPVQPCGDFPDTVKSSCSLFRVITECNEVGEMYVWSGANFVWRFYEMCRPEATAGSVDVKMA